MRSAFRRTQTSDFGIDAAGVRGFAAQAQFKGNIGKLMSSRRDDRTKVTFVGDSVRLVEVRTRSTGRSRRSQTRLLQIIWLLTSVATEPFS